MIETQVKVGQVWKDNDKRGPQRYIRVVSIEGDKATCARVMFGTPGEFVDSPVKVKTKIALRRFRPTSTGYVLVTE